MSFRSLDPPLDPRLLRVLEDMFGEDAAMTPVQNACIPLFRQNKDVAVEAVTGSGKTLAFLLPVLERLLGRTEPLTKREVGAIIISPTRELAEQTHSVLRPLVAALDGAITSVLLMGGNQTVGEDLGAPWCECVCGRLCAHTVFPPERWGKTGGHVVVATPGRLLDVLQRNVLHVHELEVLVLDEADRLLDMGFQTAISAILKFLPKQRRTGLFSATQTESIEQLMRAGLRNPVRIRVKVENARTKHLQTLPERLASYYAVVPLDRKLDALVWFLSQHREHKVIVYFLTCATVDYMYRLMQGLPQVAEMSMMSFHGKIPSKKRTKLLERFTAQPAGVLLVTDVAARGIDFPNVDWVVQWDAPQDPAAYTHRIGRTARMGRAGSGLVLLTPEEEAFVEYLEAKKIGPELMKLPALDELPETFEVVRARAVRERELYERSHEAFVSYVRGYREHVLSFIFELKKLDLGLLARCFGLVRFPAMPELKGRRPESFVPLTARHHEIPYLDPAREQQRQAKLKREREVSHAEKKEKALDEKRKRLKLHRKKRVVIASHEFTDRDLEELALEARLLKKEHQGKMTARQVDKTLAQEALKSERIAQDELLRKKEKRKERKRRMHRRAAAEQD